MLPERLAYIEHLTDDEVDLLWERMSPSLKSRLVSLIDRLSSVATGEEPTGISLIAAERKRQVDAEGWDATHDDEHGKGEMALAAAVYAWPAPRPVDVKKAWPWERSWFKLTLAEGEPKRCGCRSVGEYEHCATIPERAWRRARIHDLTKAGALIAAEIDRLNRASTPSDPVERPEVNR